MIASNVSAKGKSQMKEAPVVGISYLLKVLPVLIGRNAKMWTRFRISVVMDVLTNLAQASIFFFMGTMLSSSSQTSSPNDYITFLAVGLVLNSIMTASLRGPYASLANYYWYGRLETILLSPCPLEWVIFADVVWNYVRSIFTGVIFAVLGWIFGAEVNIFSGNFLLAILALLLGTIGVLGYGLLSAATFSLLNAKGWSDPVSWIIGTLQGLVTGVYFPITILPKSIQWISYILPQTYALDAARYLLQNNKYQSMISDGSPLQKDFTILSILCVLLLSVGIIVFRLGIVKSRRDGTLSRWK